MVERHADQASRHTCRYLTRPLDLHAPAVRVGSLGGFVPPLIMGWVYGAEGSYAIGLMLLSDVALAAAVSTAVKMSSLARLQ